MKWRACSPSVTTCSGLRILWNSKASLVMRMSPSSTSTRSTSTRLSPSRCLLGLPLGGKCGHRETEPGAADGAGVKPDPAAEVLDDLPAHCEADPGTRIRGLVVQA